MNQIETLQKLTVYYGTLGLRVFPLHPGRKTPATPHGCKDAAADPGTIAAWWAEVPYNVGIATGGGLVVLDVDNNPDAGKYGSETLSELEQQHGPLPDTWTCLTGGGGVHYYFRCEDPALTVGVEFAPGLDYRGAGGYVVAPPSIHENGREYVWEAAHTPADTPLAPLPDWLHTLMLNGRKAAPAARTEAPAGKITEGGRNDALFRLASSLRSKGLGADGITAALLAENRERCDPPLDEKEVRTIAGSAARYERGEYAMNWDGSREGAAPEPPQEEKPPPLKVISAPELQRANLPTIKYLAELQASEVRC